MNEKNRLFAKAELLKEQIEDGDRSLKTLRMMAETLDKLEGFLGLPPSRHKFLEVAPTND